MDELELLLMVIAVNAGVFIVAFLVAYGLNRSVRQEPPPSAPHGAAAEEA